MTVTFPPDELPTFPDIDPDHPKAPSRRSMPHIGSTRSPAPLASFGNPVKGRIGPPGQPDPISRFVVTRAFGDGSLPQYGTHDGLDIDNGGPAGDPIIAIDPGTVYQSFFDSGSGGAGIVRINHGGGWTSGYAHMNRLDVRVGQEVNRGQQLGPLDSTGWVTGPHLHFDTTYNGVRVDPWPRLAQNRAGAGVADDMIFRTPIVTQEWDTVPGKASTFTRPDGTTGYFSAKERVKTIAEGTIDGNDVRLLDYGTKHEALTIARGGLTNPGPRIVGSPNVTAATKAGQTQGADAVLEAAKVAAKRYGAS